MGPLQLHSNSLCTAHQAYDTNEQQYNTVWTLWFLYPTCWEKCVNSDMLKHLDKFLQYAENLPYFSQLFSEKMPVNH